MARLVRNIAAELNCEVPVSWGAHRYETWSGGRPNFSQGGQVVVDDIPQLLLSKDED